MHVGFIVGPSRVALSRMMLASHYTISTMANKFALLFKMVMPDSKFHGGSTFTRSP